MVQLTIEPEPVSLGRVGLGFILGFLGRRPQTETKKMSVIRFKYEQYRKHRQTYYT